MKFMQLGLGERFEFEGEVYTKASMMIANRERNGEPRAIPRSANCRPLGREAAPAAPKTDPAPLQRLHASARALIETLPDLDAAVRADALARLDAVYRELADAG